jgi:hypothetical protein
VRPVAAMVCVALAGLYCYFGGWVIANLTDRSLVVLLGGSLILVSPIVLGFAWLIRGERRNEYRGNFKRVEGASCCVLMIAAVGGIVTDLGNGAMHNVGNVIWGVAMFVIAWMMLRAIPVTSRPG